MHDLYITVTFILVVLSTFSWDFGIKDADAPKIDRKQSIVVVNDFIEHLMDNLSHSMHSDKYKSILDKYNDKDC